MLGPPSFLKFHPHSYINYKNKNKNYVIKFYYWIPFNFYWKNYYIYILWKHYFGFYILR